MDIIRRCTMRPRQEERRYLRKCHRYYWRGYFVSRIFGSDSFLSSRYSSCTIDFYFYLLFFYFNGCITDWPFFAQTHASLLHADIQNTSCKRRISVALIEKLRVIGIHLLRNHESVCRAKLNLLSINFRERCSQNMTG